MSIAPPKTTCPDQVRDWVLEQVPRLESVQPLSNKTLELIEACRDPDFDPARLVAIVESDPAIMARVLAVANSPLYGYSREISSIQHALVILGKQTITRLALSFGTSQGFCAEGPDSRFRKRLYEHSLACGLIARALTQLERETDPEMAFLGGVLHDIGKLVFCQLFSTNYIDLIESCPTQPSTDMEHSRFGITHQELGKLLANKWGFPPEISVVIGDHHGTPSTPVESPLGIIVEAADFLDVHRQPDQEFCDSRDDPAETGNHLLLQRDPQMLTPLLKIAWGDYEAISRAV